jgi:glycosyltransferase involved in cell wall biosynthesis
MPLKLSVAIITLNEEANLARTLKSVHFADEIIIVDSGSTDRTLEIAASFKAALFLEPWRGFAAQKNFAIEQCKGEWILSLDADEALTPELQTEIGALLSTAPAADAYLLRRRNIFLGRWIRHGGYYPDAKLRLFRRYSANFAPSARFTDRPVHETIAIQGKLETLHHDLIHHAYPTVESYIERLNHYSTLGSQSLLEHGETSRSSFGFVAKVLFYPVLVFFRDYVLRAGFLDGREGLLLHLYHAIYTSWRYAKAWEKVAEAPVAMQLAKEESC